MRDRKLDVTKVIPEGGGGGWGGWNKFFSFRVDLF